MKKKVFSVLLTVALATGVLAGCGSSAATGNNAATGAAQNEGSQTASATTAGEESGDTIVIRSCFATGMTGAVNRFAIEKGLYKELGIEFEGQRRYQLHSNVPDHQRRDRCGRRRSQFLYPRYLQRCACQAGRKYVEILRMLLAGGKQ